MLPVSPWSHHQHSNQCETFAIVFEPALTHQDHLKSIVCIVLTLGVLDSVGFNKCVMTSIHNCSYHTEWFHCPRNPQCSTYSPPTFPQPQQPLICSLFPWFCLFHNVMWLESHNITILTFIFVIIITSVGICINFQLVYIGYSTVRSFS
jgi:hypothetical protein